MLYPLGTKGIHTVTTQFHDLPSPKTFGHGFNYAVWSANTTVTLANVTWNNDYRDVVTFGAGANPGLWRERLDRYIDTGSGPVTTTTGVTYAAMGRPIRLQIPFEAAHRFNYLRAYNPAQPLASGDDTGRAYYYFVTGVNFVAPDTTEFIIQLDVFASFAPDAVFGSIFLERGHKGIANEASFTNYGRDYLTTPEGFDLGNEYVITGQFSHVIAGARDAEPDYNILVVSSTALDEDPGTVDAPKLSSATGSVMENLPNGSEIYLFTSAEHFQSFMVAMKDKPWVTQGIMSVQAVPPLTRYGVSTTAKSIAGIGVAQVNGGSLNRPRTVVKTGWRNTIDLGRYWRLVKFGTYPYTVVEMTTYSGNPLMLKPENMQDADLSVVEVPHFAPPGARLGFYPYRYNASDKVQPTTDAQGIVNDGGEFLDVMTGIMNFPTFSVVNNGYMMFMANNANAIPYQHQSADWSQQRALAAANTGYDQATSGMANANNQVAASQQAMGQSTNLANEAQAAHMMVNGVAGMVSGAGRGAAMGGAAGAAGGALGGALNFAQSGVNTAIDMNVRNQQLGINYALGGNQLASQQANAGFIRDTNLDLARFSAQGDYANAIAGVNAKVQDAKLTQPTTAGQVGGDAFNLAVYRWGVDFKIKTLQPAVMNAIGEFWLRYGYAVNRFTTMTPGLMCMEKFTYWKCKEVYITHAECPETFKQTLRGIFEKGVTVWSNPDDIGRIDAADNAPLGGITL